MKRKKQTQKPNLLLLLYNLYFSLIMFFVSSVLICLSSIHALVQFSDTITCQGPKQKTLRDTNLQTNLHLNLYFPAYNSSTLLYPLTCTHPIYELLDVWKRLKEKRSPCRCRRCQISPNVPQQDTFFSNFLPGVAAWTGPLLQLLYKAIDLHLWCVCTYTHATCMHFPTHSSSATLQFNPS